MTAALVLAAAVASGGAYSNAYRSHFPLPDAVVGSGWGVNIHFTKPEPGEMDAIAGAGFKWVRMDFMWAAVERVRGRYDFSAYDELMTALADHHMRALFILDYGNDLYGPDSPNTDAQRAAFARFAGAAMAHFRHRGVVWELWNEPNISFWKPTPDAGQYALLEAAVRAEHTRVARDEWYVGPGTSTFDWRFLEFCLANCLHRATGAAWDGISVHPYRGGSPESVDADWQRLGREADAAAGRQVALVSSEWGYSCAPGGVSEDRQADYAVRAYFANLMSGVDLSILYDWKDDGASATDPEAHFGTVHQDLRAKAGYRLIQTVNRDLAGFRYGYRLDLGDPHAYALVFRRGADVRVYGWLDHDGQESLSLAPGENPVTLNARPARLSLSNTLTATLRRRRVH